MKKLLLFTFTIAFFVGFTACDSAEPGAGTGTMKVTMTDAPAHYESVNVTIEKVRVHKNEDAETDGTESDEDAEEEGWVTIQDEQMQVNLLELTNGHQVSLGTQELETGRYNQMRFVLGENNTVTVDGETHDLQTPSGQQSGIKLNIDAEIEEDSQYSLLVDFDATRSIVRQGNGGYLLEPVLRAVNINETGSIVGNVEPSDFETNVLAVVDEDTIASTITAENGDFKIIGLLEDTYEVVFDPSSDEYSESSQPDVEVTTGEEADIGTIELDQN